MVDDKLWTGGEDEVIEPDEDEPDEDEVVVSKTPAERADEAKIKRAFNKRVREIEGREGVVSLDDARQRAQHGDGSRENPFREKGAEVVKEVFTGLSVSIRWNIRAREIEFRDTSEGGDPPWLTASDRATSDLRERIAKRYWHKARTALETAPLRFSKESWKDALDAIAFHHEVDPFLIWLDQLPPWDSIPRIEHILCSLFGCEDNDLTRWASRAPFVGSVQRTRVPGSIIHESPVLISEEQGLGKSGLVRAMVPPEHADQWHGDALDLASSKKEQGEVLAGRVVVEISELAGLRRSEIESVKTFLSRTNDGQFRPAYGRASEASPRRCVFIGTSNDMQCLANDPSGNRRLTPVVLAHGANVEEAADKNRTQWWAEAVALQAQGDDGRLPRRLISEQRIRAETHRSRDEHLEDLVMGLPAIKMTISEIHEQIDDKMKSTISDQRLGAALRVQGWAKRKVRDGAKTMWNWTPPADTFSGE